MNAPQKTQADHLYQAARELVPTLRQRSAETATLGQLPPATVEAMQQAGFFRIMQPARFDGFEMDPEVFFRVQMILAEGCMSTAWVLGVVAISLRPARRRGLTQCASLHHETYRDRARNVCRTGRGGQGPPPRLTPM